MSKHRKHKRDAARISSREIEAFDGPTPVKRHRSLADTIMQWIIYGRENDKEAVEHLFPLPANQHHV